MSVPQTADRSQITGPPFITLVDIDGHPVPTYEKGLPPFDPTDPETWPQCYETDCVHYEISDPGERDAIFEAAIEAETDRRDAVDPWTAMFIESSLPPIRGGAPEPFEPSAEDWADYHAWADGLDNRRRQISDVEEAMLAAGLPVG